ncbi:MAG: HAMP domain-containing histidine kinase [Gammaproteobacteria bacterium]|nr:HAMP domain-containing histidine kinase [Gammaproteobacteria bacterium]MDH5803339.1 HAMP domain-containing histidine kinase [Gammaproteobacteria bacterium]
MKKPNKKSFGFQLTLIITACLIFMELGFAWYHFQSQTTTALRLLNRETSAIAKSLSVSLAPLIKDNLITDIETRLATFTPMEDISTITILSNDGSILTEVSRNADKELEPTFRFGQQTLPETTACMNADGLICNQAINYTTQSLGWIRVTSSFTYIDKVVTRIWLDTLAQALITLILCAVVVLPYMSKKTRALIQAANFARNIPANTGKTMPVNASTWELENLGNSLNSASEMLYRQELEISDKTRLLEQKNRDLHNRIRELQSNYQISEILDNSSISLPDRVQNVCFLLTAALSGEDLIVKIATDEQTYLSSDTPILSHLLSHKLTNGEFSHGHIDIGSRFPDRYDLPEDEENLVIETAKKISNALTKHKITQQLLSSNARLEQRVIERTEQLEFAKTSAEHANQVKSQFLSNMSHELRTPLNAILGFTQLMELGNIEENAKKNYLRQITHSSQHLLELVNNALDLSSFENGTIVLEPELTNLSNVVNEAVNAVTPWCKDKNIRIYVNCMDNLNIVTDKSKIYRSIVNLLTNAIKYNKPNGEVTLVLSRNYDGKAIISVSDTGVGIDQAKIGTIFEPFERATLDTNLLGTGIGLCITKYMVELIQGQIEVHSTLGEGSEFKIYLDSMAA